jgi:hypothetical protein
VQGLSLLHDTPTKQKGDEDDKKNNSEDDVNAEKKNAHSWEIYFMTDTIRKDLMKQRIQETVGQRKRLSQ